MIMMNFREELRKIKDERAEQYATQADTALCELISAIQKLDNKKLFNLKMIEMKTNENSITFKLGPGDEPLYTYCCKNPEDLYGIKESILRTFKEENIDYQINSKDETVSFYIS